MITVLCSYALITLSISAKHSCSWAKWAEWNVRLWILEVHWALPHSLYRQSQRRSQVWVPRCVSSSWELHFAVFCDYSADISEVLDYLVLELFLEQQSVVKYLSSHCLIHWSLVRSCELQPTKLWRDGLADLLSYSASYAAFVNEACLEAVLAV